MKAYKRVFAALLAALCMVSPLIRVSAAPFGAEETPKTHNGVVARGDADGDGALSAADARLALRRAVGLETYSEDSRAFIACDADGDKTLTPGDARLILRASVGLEKLKG